MADLSRSWTSDQTKNENKNIFSRKMVKLKTPQIAGQKVLKQYCHKSVLRIKQKLKKMDLTWTSLVSKEIKLTKVLYFLKGLIGKKRLHLKKCILLDNVFS